MEHELILNIVFLLQVTRWNKFMYSGDSKIIKQRYGEKLILLKMQVTIYNTIWNIFGKYMVDLIVFVLCTRIVW